MEVVLCLGLGMVLGHFAFLLGKFASAMITISLIAIYVSVGVGLKDGLIRLKSNPGLWAYLALPVLITLGSLGGGLSAVMLVRLDHRAAMAIGGGMAYYSLTAAMVTQKIGIQLGFVAFLANFLREILTFFTTPWLSRVSSLAPIALGAASTMDTTLGVMRRCLGEEYAIIAFVSGVILTLVVPFLLMLVLSL
jgi:uncharacterized membrane protein YbjE (DUF340 family)